MTAAWLLARFMAGVMTGFTLLHLVTVLVYKAEFSKWVGFFILDANRSTPALFVLGPAVALTGLIRTRPGPVAWLCGLLLLSILALNSTVAGLTLVALGGALFALRNTPRAQPVVFVGLALALFFLFPPDPDPPSLPSSTLRVLGQIRDETPPDALFVIPVGLSAFRHYTQRSAYVDFKLFSVAQPDQATLTRSRMEQVANPAPENRNARGWHAAQLWEEDQHSAATCARMKELLEETGAEYYLRRVAVGETPPECGLLPTPIQSETLALYGPSG